MAVYKIFPEKDATLYSLFPSMNTGLDPIIEATETSFNAFNNPNPQVSRFLIKFPTCQKGGQKYICFLCLYFGLK